MVFSKEDKISIKKTLRESKGYGVKRFIKEFPDILNITFELTDCVDFVNNLSPYVLCFV